MAKRILAVIDMQNDFTTGVLGNKECQAAIASVLKVIETGSYDMAVATRDTHGENYMDTAEGKKLPVVHCIKDTEGWEIVSDIETALLEKFGKDGVAFFDKPSFGSKALAEYFGKMYRDDQDMEIDFVGVCTGICVISNVALAKAFCPEARISVIADACACVTADSHQTALNAMKTFQVDII